MAKTRLVAFSRADKLNRFSSELGRPISAFVPRVERELFVSQANFNIPAGRAWQLGPMFKKCGTGEGILHRDPGPWAARGAEIGVPHVGFCRFAFAR